MIHGWRLTIVDWCLMIDDLMVWRLMIVDWCLILYVWWLTIDDCWQMFDGSCLMIDEGWFMINDFWLMIIMMTMVVVWCTRLGWSFIAALNAGCLVPLFPPSSTFTVNKVSLSTTLGAAKRCWDTLLKHGKYQPRRSACTTVIPGFGIKGHPALFFSTWSRQATAGDSKPDIQNKIPHAHRIEKVGNGGDSGGGWRMEEAKWAVEGCWSEWNRKIRKSWSYLLRKRSEFRSSNFVRERTEPRRNAEMLMSTLVLPFSNQLTSNPSMQHLVFSGFRKCMAQHTLDPRQVKWFSSLAACRRSQTICLDVCMSWRHCWEFFNEWISDQPWWIRKRNSFHTKVPLGSLDFGVNTDVDFQKKSTPKAKKLPLVWSKAHPAWRLASQRADSNQQGILEYGTTPPGNSIQVWLLTTGVNIWTVVKETLMVSL